MSLTDDWKAGTLKNGWYYNKFQDGTVDIDFFDEDDDTWLCDSDKDYMSFEVITPVPSYEELQRLKEENEYLKLDNKILKQCQEVDFGTSWLKTVNTKKENQQFRQLLKECKRSTFKIYDRLRFSDENEITPADLINAVDEIKPILWGILTSINAVICEVRNDDD